MWPEYNHNHVSCSHVMFSLKEAQNLNRSVKRIRKSEKRQVAAWMMEMVLGRHNDCHG